MREAIFYCIGSGRAIWLQEAGAGAGAEVRMTVGHIPEKIGTYETLNSSLVKEYLLDYGREGVLGADFEIACSSYGRKMRRL